jgi:hypothetical protein
MVVAVFMLFGGCAMESCKKVHICSARFLEILYLAFLLKLLTDSSFGKNKTVPKTYMLFCIHLKCNSLNINWSIERKWSVHVSVEVMALCCKPEGRGFKSR